jgi:hypothetical protein
MKSYLLQGISLGWRESASTGSLSSALRCENIVFRSIVEFCRFLSAQLPVVAGPPAPDAAFFDVDPQEHRGQEAVAYRIPFRLKVINAGKRCPNTVPVGLSRRRCISALPNREFAELS